MSKLKTKWFTTKYKIVPTYSDEFQINGYVPMKCDILGWLPIKMFQVGNDGEIHERDAFFKSYEDAIVFLKHETTAFTHEEIHDTKDC